MYCISAAVVLLASLALMVQNSLPYNKTGSASVLYNFNIVFLHSPSHFWGDFGKENYKNLSFDSFISLCLSVFL